MKFKTSLTSFILLIFSLHSSAQDSTGNNNKIFLNLGIGGSLGDIFTTENEDAQPHYLDLDFGFSTRYANNMYIGLRSGYTQGNFKYDADTGYYNISQMPIGFAIGVNTSSNQAGLEFGSGLLLPQDSKLPVKGGNYFSLKAHIYLDLEQKIAMTFGYKSITNSLSDYTFLRRQFMSVGVTFFIH